MSFHSVLKMINTSGQKRKNIRSAFALLGLRRLLNSDTPPHTQELNDPWRVPARAPSSRTRSVEIRQERAGRGRLRTKRDFTTESARELKPLIVRRARADQQLDTSVSLGEQ